MKCDVIVETCRNSFSCFMQNSENLSYRLIGEGKTVRKAIEDFFIARDEMKQMYEEEGRQFVEPEWNFIFDVGAFLDYYPINVTAFAKYSGINASLLRQYASGLAKPKQKNIERIRKALDTVGKDICNGHLIDGQLHIIKNTFNPRSSDAPRAFLSVSSLLHRPLYRAATGSVGVSPAAYHKSL